MSQCVMNITGQQCPNKAIWKNPNGVEVCSGHKILLNAFTWENRNQRKWKRIKEVK